MRKIISFCGIVILVLSVIAIGSAPAIEVDKPKVKVMTRNLYLGGDIFKVVDAAQTNPSLIPWVVAEVFQTMLQSNFRARAEAIADEIADAKPSKGFFTFLRAFLFPLPLGKNVVEVYGE